MARAGSHGAGFSSGLTYTLLQLSDRAESQRPEDAIWRSQLHYRLARFFRDRVKGDETAARTRGEQLLLRTPSAKSAARSARTRAPTACRCRCCSTGSANKGTGSLQLRQACRRSDARIRYAHDTR
jgi:hypothetical protein